MKMPTKRRTWRVPREQLAPIEATLFRVYGLQADTGLLEEREQAELVEFAQVAATDGGGGLNLTQLPERDRRKFERLVAKAAAKPSDYFDTTRRDAAAFAKVRELAVRARRPEARPRWEERGAVVLSREVAFDWFRQPEPILHVEHLGLLVFLAGMFENGEAHGRTARFEGAGDELTLVVDANLGLGAASSFDADGSIGRGWRRYLEHLEANGFFVVERNGRTWRIKRGPRAVALTKGRRTP